MDPVAMAAYQPLMVLTLRDTSDVPEYKDFVKKVNRTATTFFPGMVVQINYYIASFFDSVLVYALSINKTLQYGQSIDRRVNVLNMSTEQWGKTFPGKLNCEPCFSACSVVSCLLLLAGEISMLNSKTFAG